MSILDRDSHRVPRRQIDHPQETMTVTRRLLRAMLAMGTLAAVSLALSPARAADYPTRPIKLIVPWGAGSGIDVQTRQFATAFAEAIGGPVVVENRTGAGSQIGYEIAARAEPDGYTLFAGTNANFIHQFLRPTSKIDPLKDMAPITLVNWLPSVLVVAKDSPVRSVDDLVALARSRPGALAYGSGGMGAASHLLASAIVSRNGLDVAHVPLRTLTADLAPMLARGDIHFAFPVTSVAANQIAAGTVRPIAITSAQRHPQWPDVPTLAESFKDERYVADSWNGLFAPAGTPEPILRKIFAAAVKAVDSPLHQASARTLLTIPEKSDSPAAFRKFLEREALKWRDMVVDSGIKAE
ncbi:Bug family tripartite tricarboxylate transporter substrate binding protein [Zeimonas arvi]|nr:tripartite tricarboxylate transporter substrate binding protein [Zeimonas arvi]